MCASRKLRQVTGRDGLVPTSPRVTRAVAAQCRSISYSGLHGRVELRLPPEGAIDAFSFRRPVLVSLCRVSSPHTRRRSGSRHASVAGPFRGREQ